MRGQQDIAAWYRILDLPLGATLAEVKEAYRDLAFVWHPDRYPEEKPRLKQKAEEKLKQINEAYEGLQQHLNRPVSPPPPTPSRRPPLDPITRPILNLASAVPPPFKIWPRQEMRRPLPPSSIRNCKDGTGECRRSIRRDCSKLGSTPSRLLEP